MNRKHIEAIKEEIVKVCQCAYAQKLVAGSSGNLSAYLRETDEMLITPSGIRYEAMRPEDIMVITLDGGILAGPHKPSSEWQMHAEVYRHFAGVNAVFHTHSPHATAFAVNHAPIPAALIEMHVFLGGAVECAPYATPGTPELGLSAIPMLQGKGGCLLANHGVLAVGKDIQEAYIRAEYIEDAAKIYSYAKALGTPVPLESLVLADGGGPARTAAVLRGRRRSCADGGVNHMQ